MSGPLAEGGPLPPADPELLARHEERIAEFVAPRQRVLAVVPDERGGWDVGVSLERLDEQADPGDPALVRLFVHGIDGRSAHADVSDEVLQRIADRIRELALAAGVVVEYVRPPVVRREVADLLAAMYRRTGDV